MIEEVFYELIRVAIGTQTGLSYRPKAKEWQLLYEMAKKQSLIGICFAGVQKLCCSNEEYHSGIGELQYLTWMGMTAKIQQRSQAMDYYTQKTLELFCENGFPCQVLKGQGIAKLYGSLAALRQSGDIDAWVPGKREKLYNLSMKSFGKLKGLTYHHIHFPAFDDCEIEAHTWPAFLTCPFDNKKLHKFFSENAPKPGCEDTPSLAFNRVFILLHCYEHFCGHGVGMRQLLDYYFVLAQGFTDKERTESMSWIESLGMKRFATALMWLCKEVLKMPEKFLICKPNEKYGRFLLDEVMKTGNMGHQDERVDHRKLKNAFGRYIHNLKRDYKVARICPHYALWEPFWGVYQFVWVRITYLKYT
ncbi:MAG: nucleotidyltransferase family protein [Paraprevotella sp.]|nr:nucleotidyltransferase family protein [Paraprevotella sp.]